MHSIEMETIKKGGVKNGVANISLKETKRQLFHTSIVKRKDGVYHLIIGKRKGGREHEKEVLNNVGVRNDVVYR